MTTVNVNLNNAGEWKKPCEQAVANLNSLFKQHKINVVLATGGSKGPTITVKIDGSIKMGITHGTTRTVMRGGKLWHSDVGVPTPALINISTPKRVRRAGPGVFEVIAAHELVHALGHTQPPHNTHLMAQTFEKAPGDSAAGDKLKEVKVVKGAKQYGATLPPLKLSTASVAALKKIWK